ncbi:dTMP kinase [Ignatzschineria sp. LJL83]
MTDTCSNQGCFITFEGTEGAGKTTQIERVQSYLQEKGFEVVTTREPGGTLLGEKIRNLLLNDDMTEMAELLLMFSARAEHLERVILPAINTGKWVLCDRFTESSYAYQGYARGISLEKIKTLETLIQGPLRPNCTFWFDIPVVEGMKRVGKRGGKDRFETEDIAFFEAVAKGFSTLSKERPDQFFRVDALLSIHEVSTSIYQQLDKIIGYTAE